MRTPVTIAILVAALLLAPGAALPQGDAPAGEPEVLEYRWSLQGVVGLIARIFIPGKGAGVLRTGPDGAGRLETELRITSKDAAKEEYWVYGSTFEPDSGLPVDAWNAYHFRDRTKRREAEAGQLEGDRTIDIPSGIALLRRERPERPKRMRLWSDGKLYPIEIVPGGRERRRIGGGQLDLDRYTVRGVELPGERLWKGSLDVWIHPGEDALPVEILFKSGRGKVHLELAEPPGG